MRALAIVVLGLLAGCPFHPPGAAADGPPGGDDTPPTIDATPATWWDPAYPARMQLTIENTSAVELVAGFQVGFGFGLDVPPCAGDRANVRVVRGDGELDRVLDEVGGKTWIWFALAAPIAPGTSSGEYYLYCGNPAPPPAPADPTAVFVFHDSFNRTTLGPDWQSQSSVTLNGEVVILGGSDSGIITNQRFGPGHAIDFRVRVTDATQAVFWAGFQDGFPDIPPWLHWWSMNPGEARPDYWGQNSGTQWYGTPVVLDTGLHLYGVENYGDASAYRYADAIVDQHAYDVPPVPDTLNARLHNNTWNSYAEYDMVRIRLAVNPPPGVTVGAVEHGP